jgi:hypothetical protein
VTAGVLVGAYLLLRGRKDDDEGEGKEVIYWRRGG